MEVESEKSHNAVAEAIQRLRKHVSTMLGEGSTPNDLAFALAFVATEMSMQLLNTPTAAVPVVLNGVAAAALARSRQEAAESGRAECPDEIDLDRPDGNSLH